VRDFNEFPRSCFEGMRKTAEKDVRTVELRSEIGTDDFPRMKQVC
jgi:hypothetical protein